MDLSKGVNDFVIEIGGSVFDFVTLNAIPKGDNHRISDRLRTRDSLLTV